MNAETAQPRGSVKTLDAPSGIRTRATTLKGWRPGPLVDGGGRVRVPLVRLRKSFRVVGRSRRRTRSRAMGQSELREPEAEDTDEGGDWVDPLAPVLDRQLAVLVRLRELRIGSAGRDRRERRLLDLRPADADDRGLSPKAGYDKQERDDEADGTTHDCVTAAIVPEWTA
jgi:hypothetical protein